MNRGGLREDALSLSYMIPAGVGPMKSGPVLIVAGGRYTIAAKLESRSD